MTMRGSDFQRLLPALHDFGVQRVVIDCERRLGLPKVTQIQFSPEYARSAGDAHAEFMLGRTLWSDDYEAYQPNGIPVVVTVKQALRDAALGLLVSGSALIRATNQEGPRMSLAIDVEQRTLSCIPVRAHLVPSRQSDPLHWYEYIQPPTKDTEVSFAHRTFAEVLQSLREGFGECVVEASLRASVDGVDIEDAKGECTGVPESKADLLDEAQILNMPTSLLTLRYVWEGPNASRHERTDTSSFEDVLRQLTRTYADPQALRNSVGGRVRFRFDTGASTVSFIYQPLELVAEYGAGRSLSLGPPVVPEAPDNPASVSPAP